jgi:anti-sigma regulatory factor (Ser/Thr protein kinase)
VREQTETRSFGMSESEVVAIDRWLEDVFACWDASERATFGARLCVAELAANAVEHGVASTDADHMVVTVRRRSNGIELEFLDSRAPFDPTGRARIAGAQCVKSEVPGGYGLTLLHAYAAGLIYSYDGTYNRVRLTVSSN